MLQPRRLGWVLAVGNKVALLGFLTADHTRWLRQHGVLRGPHGAPSFRVHIRGKCRLCNDHGRAGVAQLTS
jgi:hypothetical protein